MAIRAGAAPRSRWWIVVAGVVAGLVAMVLQLQRGDSLVRAFGEGLGVDFGVMIVCAVSVRLGRGDAADAQE